MTAEDGERFKSHMQQIQIEKTLDVELVERQLADLWTQNAGDRDQTGDAPVLRARVANLLVFVSSEPLLNDFQRMVGELTAIHPSRVLVMLGDKEATERDIDMYAATFCQTDKRTGARRLCCEQVTLKASGTFIKELPSAALPLLVSDLSTFLWWREEMLAGDKVLFTLLRSSDRLIIDSNEFENPLTGLIHINEIFNRKDFKHVGISDLNWARLTLWRGLLADFYDVPAYQFELEKAEVVTIDYTADEKASTSPAAQAVLFSGWLASRLGWHLISQEDEWNFTFETAGPAKRIKLKLNQVQRPDIKPGRLVEVKLASGHAEDRSLLRVGRSEDALHLFAEAELKDNVHRGRVLPVRNRSAAQLLSREMEILCNDDIYQQALAVAATLIDLPGSLKQNNP